jgi:hypothetical protein
MKNTWPKHPDGRNNMNEKLIEKIRKLLALSGCAGATQSEAESALLKAKTIAIENGIDIARIKTDAPKESHVRDMGTNGSDDSGPKSKIERDVDDAIGWLGEDFVLKFPKHLLSLEARQEIQKRMEEKFGGWRRSGE